MQFFPWQPPDFIFQWYERYEMAEFDKFIYLWMSFNAWLEKYTATKSKTDRKMIEEFKKTDKANYQEFIKQNSELKSNVEWLCENGVIDNRKETLVKPKSIDDFDGIVECIYTIRCNLFHGSYKRDVPIDRKTVAMGTDILAGIYGPILKRERDQIARLKFLQWQGFQQS